MIVDVASRILKVVCQLANLGIDNDSEIQQEQGEEEHVKTTQSEPQKPKAKRSKNNVQPRPLKLIAACRSTEGFSPMMAR